MHGVSFSASGNKLAWVGHDSSISVVNAANECKMATIKGDFLPFMDCVWVTENSIITAGKMSSFKELLFTIKLIILSKAKYCHVLSGYVSKVKGHSSVHRDVVKRNLSRFIDKHSQLFWTVDL